MKKLFKTKKVHTVSEDLQSMVSVTKYFFLGIEIFKLQKRSNISIELC